MRKILLFLLVILMYCTMNSEVVEANLPTGEYLCIEYEGEEYSAKANYGVVCDYCGETDYMKYLGVEQVGVGGTMYILYYKCENCGAVTTDVLNARFIR